MVIEDMESFLPSEVARLVYGYLEEENCFSAAQAFLETSEHLQECLSVAKKGRKFNTRIMGRNLSGLLDMLSEVASLVKEYAIDVSCDLPRPTKLNAILHLLQINLEFEKYKTSSVSITSTSQGDESIPDGQLERLRKKVEISLSPDTQICSSDSDNSSLVINRKIEPMSCEGSKQEITPSCDHPTDPFTSEPEVHKDVDKTLSNGSDEPMCLNIKKELYSELDDPIQIMDSCSDNEVYSTEHQEQQRYDQGGGINDEGSSAGRPLEHNPPHQQHQQQSSSSSILFQSYNMLRMIQPQQQTAAISVQQTYQSPSVPTVYMHAIPPQVAAIQNGLCAFGANNSIQPAIMSGVTTTTSQNPLWVKPKTPVPRKVPKPVPPEQPKLSPRKRYRNLKPSAVPKLRPIAPKITQVLDNGVEVQVVHTKESPLVDLTETIPPIYRRSLRSRTKADSTNVFDDGFHHLNGESLPPSPGQPPPSPLFIDIQNFELKR